LAEAGFIVDELDGLGIQARIHQIEEFSAAVDRRSIQYLVRVPENFAPAAADHIGQYLTEESQGQRTILQRLRESVDIMPAAQSPSWRPGLALVIVGVMSFLLGHEYSEQAAPRPPRSTDLTSAIASVGRPFLSEAAPNQPSYRLSLDAGQKMWTLGVDRDHDGVFESAQRFTATGAAR
jgi:hypothetical protein